MDDASIKKKAGEMAAGMICDGMIVGLGTGSTVAYTIQKLGEMVKTGLCITCVPTSIQTAIRADTEGIPLTTLDLVSHLDIAIDGADQIDPASHLIKGRGAALVREKIVAKLSDTLIIVADQSKYVNKLTGPIPIEVLPCGLYPAIAVLQRMGGTVTIREGIKKDGPVISDNGNIIIDYEPESDFSPESYESSITMIPGVLECGIFSMFTKKTKIILAGDDGCRVLTTNSGYNSTGLV